jgi:hypothetical protein
MRTAHRRRSIAPRSASAGFRFRADVIVLKYDFPRPTIPLYDPDYHDLQSHKLADNSPAPMPDQHEQEAAIRVHRLTRRR